MDDDDVRGRGHLGFALVVAMLVAVVLWNVLACEPVRCWIWGRSDGGRIDVVLAACAVALVFASYVATFAVLGAREMRRWHARVPVARVRRSR